MACTPFKLSPGIEPCVIMLLMLALFLLLILGLNQATVTLQHHLYPWDKWQAAASVQCRGGYTCKQLE